MPLRQMNPNDDEHLQRLQGGEEPSGSASLRQAREDADSLLRAADDAINRALSHDSNEFLQQARQHGGE